VVGLLGLLVLAWAAAFLSVRFESHQYTELSSQQRAAAKTYFEKSYEPLPADWQWSHFSPEPEVELRTGYIEAPNAKGTVIIVPGFTSPIEMNARAIAAFNSAGYRVAAIDYRGQGGSWRPLANPEKGYVEDYAILADDLAGYAERVRLVDKPLFIFAISKGAHITMRAAEHNQAKASAYALAVPMIQIQTPDTKIPVLKLLSGAATLLGLGSAYPPGLSGWPPKNLVFGEATDCNANPETAQIQDSLFGLNPELRVSGVTMRWLKETIDSSDYIMSPEFTGSISEPVRIFNAGDDRIVNASAANAFCDSLNHCSVTEFANARHCINRENYSVYDQILEQTIDFFDQV